MADFNNPDKLGRGKEMVDRLSNLVAIFENPSLDFRKNRAEGDDLLGDAYEYLMRHFASQSGKAKGQFLTPSEVSRVMAKIVGIAKAQRQDQTAYDHFSENLSARAPTVQVTACGDRAANVLGPRRQPCPHWRHRPLAGGQPEQPHGPAGRRADLAGVWLR